MSKSFVIAIGFNYDGLDDSTLKDYKDRIIYYNSEYEKTVSPYVKQEFNIDTVFKLRDCDIKIDKIIFDSSVTKFIENLSLLVEIMLTYFTAPLEIYIPYNTNSIGLTIDKRGLEYYNSSKENFEMDNFGALHNGPYITLPPYKLLTNERDRLYRNNIDIFIRKVRLPEIFGSYVEILDSNENIYRKYDKTLYDPKIIIFYKI